ncbi:MAG: DEAD/DEAH box helicase, partial [Thermomicrobiales bacterium]
MTTRTGVAEPRPTIVDEIEAEAAALLEEAGLSTETPSAPKKPRRKTAAAEPVGEDAAAVAPAPRKSRTKAVPLQEIGEGDAAEPAPVARKPRKKTEAVAAEPVETPAQADTSVVDAPRKARAPKSARTETASGAVVVAEAATSEPQASPSDASGPGDEPESAQPTFSDLGLGEAILKSVKDVGYEAPSPIQLITIPALLRGVDVIAQAQTGSGKTAAFGLPIIERMDGRDRHVQALILTPTRELAIQVAEALHKYGKQKHIETLPIYGGQPYERQFRGLQRGPQIVVGTPGRVMDHMRRGTLNLDHIRFFVLDEADEMLDMGFIEDIEWVLEHAPAERQTALFSATMPPRIVDLSRRYLKDPERLIVPGKQMTVPATRQTYYEVPRARKIDALTRILDAETPPLT